jgi:hypothetical protein
MIYFIPECVQVPHELYRAWDDEDQELGLGFGTPVRFGSRVAGPKYNSK